MIFDTITAAYFAGMKQINPFKIYPTKDGRFELYLFAAKWDEL